VFRSPSVTTRLDLRTPLRTRLLIGMGLMLLPIVALAILTFVSSRAMVAAIEEVVDEQVHELQPVSSLFRQVLLAGMAPNDYLITANPAERALFERRSAEVDAQFTLLLKGQVFGSQEERRLVEAAQREWGLARRVALELFEVSSPVGDVEAARRMKAFDDHLERASDALGALYDRVLLEVRGYETRARAVRASVTTLLVVVSLLSLALAGGAGVVLSRSIVVPVRALQDGILRFAEGDHSFRLELAGRDEFGQVAEVMNQLAERLEHDQLTGVASRGALQRQLHAELVRARRFQRPFSVVMVDVDHFKRVNDAHGHPAGDQALQAVARRLSGALRTVDTVARYGGEEFALVLPETAGPGARTLAERLREAVAAGPIEVSAGVSLPITVSVGVASFPSDAEDDTALLAAADRALYAAKAWGRNRVVEAAEVDATRREDPVAADRLS
jgi:diguanylate cyclase (GGDEF)-like protein